MQTIKIIQMCAGLAAITAIVAMEALGVSLSQMALGLLAFVAGWAVKRPSDMIPAQADG
jgi:hypothetical protein